MAHVPLSEVKFYGQDKVVIDTNVLIFLHGQNYEPSGRSPNWAAPYSKAYRDLLTAGSEYIILDVVVGEFFKVLESKASRYWFRAGSGRGTSSGDERADLKDFRRRGPHTTLVKDFHAAVRQLLSENTNGKFDRTQWATPPFSALEQELKDRKVDFNDLLIAQYAMDHDAMLLTADADLLVFEEQLEILHEPRNK